MMNTQDDSIDKDELVDLSQDDDEVREPSTYKIWVHIEGIDEDGEPIDGDADLPTEICEVDTLDEATDVVAKLEAVNVFEKEDAAPDVKKDLLAALKAAYVALSESDAWQDMGEEDDDLSVKIREAIAKAEGR